MHEIGIVRQIIRTVTDFAEKNGIEYIPVEKADHRFMDPKLMDLAIEYIQMFLEL